MSLPIQFRLIDIAGPDDTVPASRSTTAARTTAHRGGDASGPTDAPPGHSP
jgi:hypothetical protein